jgi:hypothetical protein
MAARQPDWYEPALRRSVLAGLPDDVLDRLFSGAMRLDIPSGSILYREGEAPRCGLFVSGLTRVFLAAVDGRQVTIRYMTPGSLSGASLVLLDDAVDVRGDAPRVRVAHQHTDGWALPGWATSGPPISWDVGAAPLNRQRRRLTGR